MVAEVDDAWMTFRFWSTSRKEGEQTQFELEERMGKVRLTDYETVPEFIRGIRVALVPSGGSVRFERKGDRVYETVLDPRAFAEFRSVLELPSQGPDVERLRYSWLHEDGSPCGTLYPTHAEIPEDIVSATWEGQPVIVRFELEVFWLERRVCVYGEEGGSLMLEIVNRRFPHEKLSVTGTPSTSKGGFEFSFDPREFKMFSSILRQEGVYDLRLYWV